MNHMIVIPTAALLRGKDLGEVTARHLAERDGNNSATRASLFK